MPTPSYLTIVDILGTTRRLAEDQEEYQTLPIRDETQADGSNTMVSEWRLTEEQLTTLQKGGSLYLGISGMVHPPVILAVGKSSEQLTPKNGEL